VAFYEGQWLDYGVDLKADPGHDPGMGSGAQFQCGYSRLGRLIIGWFRIVFGSGASKGIGFYTVKLPPFAPVAPASSDEAPWTIGTGWVIDRYSDEAHMTASGLLYVTAIAIEHGSGPGAGTRATIYVNGGQSGLMTPTNPVSATQPWNWHDLDILTGRFSYETVQD